MDAIFPLEIWENILQWLPLHDLLVSARVCVQWRHLAARICRQRCHRLPSRLLEELTYEQCTVRLPPPEKYISETADRHEGVVEPDWLDVSRMLLQTRVTSRPESCSVRVRMMKVFHLAAAERFMVVVAQARETEEQPRCTLNLVTDAGSTTCRHVIHGRVNKVCVMESPAGPSMLAVSVNKELVCFLVGPENDSLKPLEISPPFIADSRLCCDGQTLVVSQLVDDYHLAVFRVCQLLGRVDLKLVGRIRTVSPPVCWDLWNGFVTALVSSGHVYTFTVSGSLVADSRLYKDLRYPNPTLLTRGLIMASTITSRALLSYWHMDRDRDYWLVGESVLASWVRRGPEAVGNVSPRAVSSPDAGPLDPTEAGSSCVLGLAKVRVGAAMLLEVTVTHYQRGLVFCGTSQGHLLVYKILEGGWGCREDVQWEAMEVCVPSLSLTLTQQPVARIAAFFTDTVITVGVGDRDGYCYVVTLPNTGTPP